MKENNVTFYFSDGQPKTEDNQLIQSILHSNTILFLLLVVSAPIIEKSN